MPDKRENIMVALFAALEGVSNETDGLMAVVDRNGDQPLETDERPALRMWDGDEVGANAEARPAQRLVPVRVTAQPCIALYVTAEGSAAGTAANALLARVRKAVWTDEDLWAALGAGATIVQDSLAQDIATGSKTEGAYLLHLSLTYQFNPASP